MASTKINTDDAGDSTGFISLRNTPDRATLAAAFSTFVEQKYANTDFLLKCWEQQLRVIGEEGDLFDVIVSKAKSSSTLLGVLAYRYYPRGNFAIVYCFGVLRAHASAAARHLLRSLWQTTAVRAVPSGCIAGCDAIFVCSEQPPDGEQWEPAEIVDVCRSPALLRALNMKVFDLNMPPPHSIMLPPCRIPATFRLSAQTATPVTYGPDSGPLSVQEYVPHVLMTSAIQFLWPPKACAEENKLLLRVSSVRGGAPLLPFETDTAWPKRSPWIVVDLLHNFDQQLLEAYYRELMEPSITNKDELEPLPEVLPRVRDGSSVDPQHENYGESHPILLLNDELQVAAGAMMEYWSYPNCALVTYLLVSDRYRRRGLAGLLMQHVMTVADQCARRCGNFAGNNCVFLETNKLTVKNDVMLPAVRHQVFDKIGIKCLDFEYVQCPLADGLAKCHDLLLTVMITDRIPRIPVSSINTGTGTGAPVGNQTEYGLPSQLVHEFIDAYWRTTVPNSIGMAYLRDEDFQRMVRQCDAQPFIRVVPWPTPPPEQAKMLVSRL